MIFPSIVPFQLSLWEAASATLSHVFLLVEAAVGNTDRAGLFGIRLSRVSREDSRTRMGILKTRFQHVLWFGGLYLSSVVLLFLAFFSFRAALHLMMISI